MNKIKHTTKSSLHPTATQATATIQQGPEVLLIWGSFQIKMPLQKLESICTDTPTQKANKYPPFISSEVQELHLFQLLSNN